MTVSGRDGLLANMDKKFLKSWWQDHWNFAAGSDGKLDRRIVAFMAAYKTLGDIDRRQQLIAKAYKAAIDIAIEASKNH